MGATEVKVKADSKVVISQVHEEFATKDEKLKKYHQQVGVEHDLFPYFCIQKIPREENKNKKDPTCPSTL